MLDLVIAADLAVRSTRTEARSAEPGAPVVAARADRDRLGLRARAGLAAGLHRVATALEPRRRAERTNVACS